MTIMFYVLYDAVLWHDDPKPKTYRILEGTLVLTSHLPNLPGRENVRNETNVQLRSGRP